MSRLLRGIPDQAYQRGPTASVSSIRVPGSTKLVGFRTGVVVRSVEALGSEKVVHSADAVAARSELVWEGDGNGGGDGLEEVESYRRHIHLRRGSRRRSG